MVKFFIIRDGVPDKAPLYLREDGSWTENLDDPSVKKFSSCKKAWNEKWWLCLLWGNVCLIEEEEAGWVEREILDAHSLRLYWNKVV